MNPSPAELDLVHHEAREAWRAGLSPLPCNHEKRPVEAWAAYQRARPNAQAVRSYYPGAASLGIVTGPKPDDPDPRVAALPGVEAMDFDDEATYLQAKEHADAARIHDVVTRIENGYCDRTPRGGRRWLYRCTDVTGSQKIAHRPATAHEVTTLIETRGTGGYAVVAPTLSSVHPSGKPYVRLSGGFATIVEITPAERRALLDYLRSYDEMPAKVPTSAAPRGATRAAGQDVRPGDDYNARQSWHDVLDRYGWQALYTRRDGVTAWLRPGKTTAGLSATTGYGGSDVMKVFTSSSLLDSGRSSYDKFGVYAAYEHGGDHKAAAKALWAQGYGTPASQPVPVRLERTGEPTATDAEPTTDAARNTELRLAEQFAAAHDGQIKYDIQAKTFYSFTGHRWVKDVDHRTDRALAAYVRHLQHDALDIDDKDARANRLKFLWRCESNRGLQAVLSLIKSRAAIATSGSEWDTNPLVLCTPSGVVDLRTGALRPGQPADMITLSTRIPFDPDAPMDRFETFLNTTFAECPGKLTVEESLELLEFLWLFLGLCLTGLTTEQVWLLCVGGGANGKSTLLDLLLYVLGEYGATANADSFVGDADKRGEDLAVLRGKRVVAVSEFSNSRQMDAVRLKNLTGDEPIKCRLLHQNFMEFYPQFKLLFACNELPNVNDTSKGFWRRVRTVPFPHSFPVNASYKDGLKAQAPGILAWLVSGCVAYFQRQGLPEPRIVQRTTAQWRDDSDILGQFLNARTVKDAAAYETSAALYGAFEAWCDSEGIRGRDRWGAKRFGAEIQKHATPSRTSIRRGFTGLRLAAGPVSIMTDDASGPVFEKVSRTKPLYSSLRDDASLSVIESEEVA
ncbi:hypothetical protein LuPra_03371 [Luteitalea pratensis]|uniref:SF3 helicase domain-containing protein n=1 Tax=Luteitalea pratensis TaxID=1855912 RepID=A0A143PPR3_LUTPR|nr:phage/plasmid primase, P4 family [Luteitalea pratensis]AMY10143.1 hypothetical protein LuPra_03371 [Luteitalea pratensis]